MQNSDPFHVRVGIVGIFAILMLFAVNFAFAQTDAKISKQTTLSGDLENNPTAQEILRKIEQSKRWIEKLQQRNFEEQQRQQELEEKRAEVLRILEEDLKKWEELWGYYTFDSMLERALEDSPAKYTETIYDHPLKFTASKIHAGREALNNVVLEGGGPEEAREAFVNAAKITRQEMIYANAIYNVLHNTAYYNQQILFESDGQFNDSISGPQIRKYYQDYRTNPSYLAANPDDKASREELSLDKDTECRSGYMLIHRINEDDYVCVTEQTSEMWLLHGIGTASVVPSDNNDDLTVKKLEQDRINEKIKNINQQISVMYDSYEQKLLSVKKNYDKMYLDLEKQQKEEEKNILESSSTSKKHTSEQLQHIRDMYDTLDDNILQEKIRSFEILKSNHERTMKDYASSFESFTDVNIVWNSEESRYEAIRQ